MANVTDKVATIRNATYGNEVREGIASGIENINTEVISTTAKQTAQEIAYNALIINAGNSNAEIVDARLGETTLKAKLQNVDSSLAENIKRLDNIAIISPLDFDCVGDGVTDDSINFALAIDYCIANKKPLFITPNYVFVINDIVKTIPSSNGFYMYGSGKMSTLKVTNTNNKNGLTLSEGGNYREIYLKDFFIEGNALCGNGIDLTNFCRPSVISGISGTGFSNTETSVINCHNTIDIKIRDIFGRSNSRLVTLNGQCDSVDLVNICAYDWTEFGIGILNSANPISGLMENSVCVSIYEPYMYGVGSLSSTTTDKVAIYCEDADRLTMYGGWFENCDFAMKSIKGALDLGCPRSTILSPKRGGSIIPTLYLENADYSHIISNSCSIHVDGSTSGCEIFGQVQSMIVEDGIGKNTIHCEDKNQIKAPTEFLSKVETLKCDGLLLDTFYIPNDTVVTITPKETRGQLFITATSTSNYAGHFAFSCGASNYINKLSGSTNIGISSGVVTGTSGSVGNVTISSTSDGRIIIENRMGASKSFKVTIL